MTNELQPSAIFSCVTCGVLVLIRDEARHRMWHEELATTFKSLNGSAHIGDPQTDRDARRPEWR